MQIRGYEDFCAALMEAGFSMGGGNASGIYSVLPFDWNEEPAYETPVRWHTGDVQTDPWQWRVRVLREREDIAYAKLFFGKSGYITRPWYPYFLAARRNGRSIEEDYHGGNISRTAMRIYRAVASHGSLAVHDIKRVAAFERVEAAAFSKALVELQSRMHLTVCGEQPKISANGSTNGWMSMEYCLADTFFAGAWDEANALGREAAGEAIARQILTLNPDADARKIKKFIEG